MLALLVAVSLAACEGGQPTPVPEANRLQIFAWPRETWQSDSFSGLSAALRAQRPDLALTDLSAQDEEGANPAAVLRNSMLNNRPPDSFQARVGSDLLDTWVKTELMQPLDSLAQQDNWAAVYPSDLLKMVSNDGKLYGVPFAVQRVNLLWYNKKIFADLKLQPPVSWADFYAAAKTIKAAGITPVSIGGQDASTVLDIFDSILLADAGPDKYVDLYAGRGDWHDEKVRAALADLREYVSYSTPASRYLNWQGSCDLVYEGKAAMLLMGDWAQARFEQLGFKLGVDFAWTDAPGTAGQFIVVADAFGLPNNAPHQPAALDFLKSLGSVPMQSALAASFGATSARTDVDKSTLDAYHAAAVDALAKGRLVPSAAHGSATVDLFALRLQDTIGKFLGTGDLDGAQAEIVADAAAALK